MSICSCFMFIALCRSWDMKIIFIVLVFLLSPAFFLSRLFVKIKITYIRYALYLLSIFLYKKKTKKKERKKHTSLKKFVYRQFPCAFFGLKRLKWHVHALTLNISKRGASVILNYSINVFYSINGSENYKKIVSSRFLMSPCISQIASPIKNKTKKKTTQRKQRVRLDYFFKGFSKEFSHSTYFFARCISF